MSAPIITLFEAYGAGALVVGPRLAGRLGVPWIGQQTSSEALDLADPKGSGHVDTRAFLQGLAFVDQGSIDLLESPYQALARQQAAEVGRLVTEGGVILGRNATIILHERPDSLHVKLDGPVQYRIRQAMDMAGIPAETAALRQAREDAARAEISLDVWGWDPRQTAYFDLVLDTAAFGLDGAEEIILEAFRRKNGGVGGGASHA